MTDPHRVAQDEELESLRAIYGDDFQDIAPKKTAWGTEVDEGWWEILLRGREDPRVEIRLRGKMGKAYPKAPPQLALAEPRNLTADHVKVLTRKLQEEAKALASSKQEYYISILADYAQDWIDQNHMTLPKPGEIEPNLLELKEQREEAQAQIARAEREAAEQQKRREAEEEQRRLTEKIQLDASRKSERARQLVEEEETRRAQESMAGLQDGELASRSITLPHAIAVPGYAGSWASWTLFGGIRETLWTSYTAEPDPAAPSSSAAGQSATLSINAAPTTASSGSANTNRFVTLNMPILNVQTIDFSSPQYNSAHWQRKLDSLITEIQKVQGVVSSHLLRIYAVYRTVSPRGWPRLMIFTEKLREGGRIRGWLPDIGLGEEAARSYLVQVLEGLVDLHRSGHTQRQLDLDSTLISSALPSSSSPSSRTAEIKLGGASYARRIIDYHRSERFLRGYHDTVPEAWKSPDEVDQPQTYTRARDMWHAGLLFLQMMYGERCLQTYSSPQVFLSSELEMSESTREVVLGLLHPFNKKRLSAEEALQVLRREDEQSKGLSRRPFVRSSSANMISSSSGVFGTSPQAPQVSFVRAGTSGSSFRRDWEELEFLGKGGFGEVVKARNKADGAVYAVKKVRLRAGDNEQRFRREASYLASLKQHPHIVRYHYCWIENIEPSDPPLSAVDSSEGETPGATTDGESSDFFKDPLKLNFDTSRKDVSKSASFPRIRFVADDADSDDEADSSSEESEEELEEETTPNPSQAALPISIKPKPSASMTDSTQESDITSILYISMEFLENETLREAIGPNLTQDEAWKYLKQVSQALAHLAAHKVVHRDLKPSNILLDSVLDAKIADFGLSTTGIGHEALLTSHTQSKDLDHTSNIGTGLYIAPEVAISNDYDEKADMYSLGIIFFEMCYPFATQMERAQIIGALRKPEIVFPTAWPENRGAEKEIIKWLLQHDPKLRPSAAELLQSPLIPKPEREQQYTDDAISALTDSNGSYYPKLIKALFRGSANTYPSLADNRHHDYTFDNDQDEGLQPWLTLVIKRLVELFERHGAVETYLPLLLPETTLLGAFPPVELQPARLLDESGKLTRLPNSGLLALARSATRKQIERIKRYHIGTQYGEHRPEGQPIAVGELCFDIVSPLRSSAAEAELLEVVDKMLSEFKGDRDRAPSTGTEYEFHISHEAILSRIVGLAPEKHRPAVLQAFKSLSSGVGSREVKERLSKVALTRAVHEEVGNCCFVDDFIIARKRLESLLTSPADQRRLQAAFEEMAGIVKLAIACGIKRKIVFRTTLSRHAEFFRGGFMFECVRRSKARDEIVAFGGRYDCLLEHFKDPAMQMPRRRVYGVGVSIAIENVARMVQKQESQSSERLMRKEKDHEKSFGYWTPARCDVYVAAGQGVDLTYRLALTKDLWRAGISADLQYDDGRAFDEVKAECLEQNTLFMILPKPNRQDMEIKVFHVLRNTDEEVPRNGLATTLQNAISEQRKIDASYASIDGSVPLLPAAPLSGAMGIPGEGRVGDDMVVLVLPPEPQTAKGTKGRPVRKFRHQTKNVYREKANEFVLSMRSSLLTIGVDLDLPLLQRLTLEGSWIWNDEKWKSLIVDRSTADRKYADEVREAVQKAVRGDPGAAGSSAGSGAWGGGDAPGAGLSSSLSGIGTAGKRETRLWLFSVRENRGFLLQVQK